MKYQLIIVLVVFIVIASSSFFTSGQFTNEAPTIYLDINSKCQVNCGYTASSAFSTLQQVLDELNKLNLEESLVPNVFVSQGTYHGLQNVGLEIKKNINLIAIGNSDNTIFDCKSTGFGFKFSNTAQFISLKGITLRKCNGYKGAAIYSRSILTSIQDSVFQSNQGEIGSAIYSESNKLEMSGCQFIDNTNGYAITLNQTNVRMENCKFSNNLPSDINCFEDSVILSSGDNIFKSKCNSDCSIINTDNGNDICELGVQTNSCDRNGICNSPFENESNCPFDCLSTKLITHAPQDDQHSGWKLVTIKGPLNKPSKPFIGSRERILPIETVSYIPFPILTKFMDFNYKSVSGILTSSLSVNNDDYYEFQLSTSNFAAILFVNGQPIIDTYFDGACDTMEGTMKVLLSASSTHHIHLVFTSWESCQYHNRQLALKWRKNGEPTFSNIPSFFIPVVNTPFCGDGICNEEIETCLLDCHQHLERYCPGQAPPSPLQSTYVRNKDFLGSLVNNQYLYSLPGIHYLSHGMDITTGETNSAPLFSFSYCDNSSFSIVQNQYRQLTYTVPEGINAQMATKCSSDISTKSFSTTSQMAQESSLSMGLDISAGGSYGGFFAKVSVSVGLSLSQTSSKSSEMESKTDGSVSLSELKCETSKVTIGEPKLHPKFIADLVAAFNATVMDEALEFVMEKYGTLYYKSAVLGGKIHQITIVEHTFQSQKTKEELERSIDMTASASFSSKISSAHGSFTASGSMDSKTSREEQNTFESNSQRSSIIVYGGTPGSYGADTANPFRDWAESVDAVPFVIDQQVGHVSDIIPAYWEYVPGKSIVEEWKRVEYNLYKKYFSQQKSYKYLSSNLITLLGREDTVYAIDIPLSNTFNITIVDNGGIHYTYNVQSTETVDSTTIFRIKFNDKLGVSSMTITMDSNTLPSSLVNNTIVNLFNVLSSRNYQFNVLYNSSIYTFAYHVRPQNTYEITIKGFTYDYGGSVIVDLIGVEDKVSFGMQYNSPNMVFQTQEYLGTIMAVAIIANPNYDNYDPNANTHIITFSSLIVTQTCPTGHSDCLEKGVESDDYGYSKSYEIWRSPVSSTNAFLQKRVFTIEPFGQ